MPTMHCADPDRSDTGFLPAVDAHRPSTSTWHRRRAPALPPCYRISAARRRRHRPARSRRGRARRRWMALRSRWSNAIPRGHKFALRSIERRRAGPQVRQADRPGDGADRARRARPHAQSGDAARRRGRVSIRAAKRAADRADCRAADVHGLSPRGRPRRHAQRDLDPVHRRLRRPHRRAHRATGRRALARAASMACTRSRISSAARSSAAISNARASSSPRSPAIRTPAAC